MGVISTIQVKLTKTVGLADGEWRQNNRIVVTDMKDSSSKTNLMVFVSHSTVLKN